MNPTRVTRTPERRHPGADHAAGFPERVALYVCARHKAQAPALLELFADAPRARAQAYAAELQACDSAMRQARLTRAFGTLPDALERAQQLIVEASPPLRRALVRHLPPALRGHFPHLDGPGEPCPPAMDALAARLAREVLRSPAG